MPRYPNHHLMGIGPSASLVTADDAWRGDPCDLCPAPPAAHALGVDVADLERGGFAQTGAATESTKFKWARLYSSLVETSGSVRSPTHRWIAKNLGFGLPRGTKGLFSIRVREQLIGNDLIP